jgi:glutathione S-transferase
MIPTALVPAVKIDGELVFESRDILMAIEKAFPESDGRLVQVDSFKPCVESAYGFSA